MPVEPTDRLVREWRERIDADRGVFLVAADADDAVQGYAYTRWREDTKAFVGDGEAGLKEIYVHPDAWGEGVGTALLDAVVERLPDDVTALKAEMLADNVVGERFYERREFERVATGSTEIAGHRYPVVVYALPLGE